MKLKQVSNRSRFPKLHAQVWILLFFTGFLSRPVCAQTMQILPASSRSENTIYCIGQELNPVTFGFFAKDCGMVKAKYPVPDITKSAPTQPIVLVVDLPQKITYEGSVDMWNTEFMSGGSSEPIEHSGITYIRHRIILDRKRLVERIIKNKWNYDVTLWLRPPIDMKTVIYWKVMEGERVLVDASTNLKTIGVIAKDTPRPKRFIRYMYYADGGVAKSLVQERVSFYSRIGVTHVNASGPMADALRAAGIKVMYQRGGSYCEILAPFYEAAWSKKSLADASAEICRKLKSDEYKQDYAANADHADGSLWDYEQWVQPGYDDLGTVKAFCKEQGLGELTPETVKHQYSKEYYAYRVKLMCAPVLAFSEMIRSVKPKSEIWICQGSGVPLENTLDYRVYDAAVDYHMPMIYVPASEFYQTVKRTVDYVNPKKLVPVMMYGYSNLMWCERPGRALLDYIGTASLGAAGLTLYREGGCDGQEYFDFYQGARMLAPVESFYLEGKITREVEIKGLPYLEKKITVGPQTLILSQPNWKIDLITKAHTDGKRTLVTLLNHHSTEDAYVELRVPKAKEDRYLINRFTGVFLTIRGKALIPSSIWQKGVMVKVAAFSPALWLITPEKKDIAGLRPLAMEDLQQAFKRGKDAASKQKSIGVPIGAKGDLSIQYAEVKDAGKEGQICLEVSSPVQTVSFASSGGRIWKWVVDGKDLVVRSLQYGGVGMDLTYRPESAWWSGEQKAEMVLKRAANSGTEVQLTYEGSLNKGKVALEKTYQFPANQRKVSVHVKLTNMDRVTPDPVPVSYWSHNMFTSSSAEPDSRIFMVATAKDVLMIQHGKESNYVYSNEQRGAQDRELLFKDWVKGTARNSFGEYFPFLKMGVLFRIPPDFLQIYRCEGGSEQNTLEWMHKPVTMPPGQSVEFDYEMEIYPATSVEEFKELIEVSVKVK